MTFRRVLLALICVLAFVIAYLTIWPRKSLEDRYADEVGRCIETKADGKWQPGQNRTVEEFCDLRVRAVVTP